MKKVLIPFDFSPVSVNAFKYALNLFDKEAHFTVFHVMDGNLSLQDPLTYTAGITRGDAIHHEMDRIITEVKNEIGVTVECISEVEIGSTVESIIDRVTKEGYDAIVMGTRSKYDLFDKWLGTISLGVVKRAGIPVYLVPQSAVFTDLQKVVIGSDNHLDSDEMLNYLEDWNESRRADFHFIHVIDDKGAEESIFKNIVEEYFEKKEVNFPFTIVQEEKGAIAERIIKYADRNAADMMILITDKMSWFETIFSNSVSKEMILKANKPVLFLSSGIRKTSKVFLNLAVV